MRILVIGTALGLLTATAIAAPLLDGESLSDTMMARADHALPTLADRTSQSVTKVARLGAPEARSPIDFDNLIRIEDTDYEVAYSDRFSDEVESVSTITKIGYGKKVEVSVIKTESGTYTTDGLASHHVRYPDIETRRAKRGFDGLEGAIWHHKFGWLPQSFSPANSVVTFGPIAGGGTFISGKGSTCFAGKGYMTCN